MVQIETRLAGPLLFESRVHGDERGFFTEAFRASWLVERGIAVDWVQDNHSRSTRGVLRGLHYQAGVAKLVRCVRGSIVDVLVDLRRDSPGYGAWEAFELNDANGRLIYVPEGFGHGFVVTSDVADVIYKVSGYWDAAAEGALRYDDPAIGIDWPDAGVNVTVSDRDLAAPLLADAILPF